ncbi:MAG: hypothetical protein ACRD63_08970 [Pyrinomonadaceae bacterium]
MSNDNSLNTAGLTTDEQLISYVYDEVDVAQRTLFEKKMAQSPALCKEVLALREVKTEVGAWRSQVMDSFDGLEMPFENAAVPVQVVKQVERKRSAMAALKAFFELSPIWMRAGVTFASLLFCALTIFTFSRAEFRHGANGFSIRAVPERVVTNTVTTERTVNQGYTQAQLDQAVAQTRDQIQADFAAAQVTQKVTQQATIADPLQPKRHGVTVAKAPSEVMANEVRVRDDRVDDNAPRLSDLLSVY